MIKQRSSPRVAKRAIAPAASQQLPRAQFSTHAIATHMQRVIGNRATAQLLSRADQPAAIGRVDFGTYVGDVWGHVKHIFQGWNGRTGDGDADGEHARASWSDNSKELAVHTSDACALASQTLTALAGTVGGPGARKLQKAAEYFAQAREKLDIAGDVFEKIANAVDTIDDARAFEEAVHRVAAIENINHDPARSAQAFDNLFAAAGRLGKHLPDKDLAAAFEFLEGFKGGLFAPTVKNLTDWEDRADQTESYEHQ